MRNIIGQSAPMLAVLAMIARVAASDLPVLILGETGTGKELVARAIHSQGGRADGPWAPVNCGAIPEALLESVLFGHERGAFTGAVAKHKGLFEQAAGGTLFLDEAGDISPQTQTSLLRALQEKEIRRLGGDRTIDIDARVVAAANCGIDALRARLRPDFYRRLAICVITLPPLRDRGEDRIAIAQSIAKKNGFDLGEGSHEAIQSYGWPGNVRELEGILLRAFVQFSNGPVTGADIQEAIALDNPTAHKTKPEAFRTPEHKKQAAWIRSHLKQNGPAQVGKMSALCKKQPAWVRRVLIEMVKEGVVVRLGRGRGTRWGLL